MKNIHKSKPSTSFFNRMTLGTRGREGGGRAKKGREKGVERGSLAERIVAGHSLKFTPRAEGDFLDIQSASKQRRGQRTLH